MLGPPPAAAPILRPSAAGSRHRGSILAEVASTAPERVRTGYDGADMLVWERNGPPAARRALVPFSVVAQIDSLLWLCLGVRLERDVLHRPGEPSCCTFTGIKSWESCSMFCGYYHTAPPLLPAAVAMLSAQHGCGLFILPPKEMWPAVTGPISKGKMGPWASALFDVGRLMLRFDLADGFSAVFVNFDWAGRFKAKRRQEKSFSIRPVDRIDSVPPDELLLGVVPLSLTRSSPLAANLAPPARQRHGPR